MDKVPMDQEKLLTILNELNAKMTEMIQIHELRYSLLSTRIQELETVNTSQRAQLFERVQDLEQFQRECETAQEYERDRS
ncbi:hypothetical protein GNF10_17330 [Nostoc sp. UCD121]|uniref:hypothetical protein n=1 Tax=unclassified Nostoc TaxID=2593658 RepID=UPI001629A7FA|nr:MULTISPECIES: hypothetical protein [unclassified Nostoc]MBC1218491.1 hypothetical protein [Nostoc sp. UCD120]MBC1277671.1 hypothetical protein [Nostoc sp. UCD121]MBC1296209.1 hypothetical protein [Nostoc sp. UCD122]